MEKFHLTCYNILFVHIMLGLGPDPNKPPCKKAKQLRLERKQQRLAQRQATTNTSQADSKACSKGTNEPKCLEEFIVDAIPGQEPKHKFEVSLYTKCT